MKNVFRFIHTGDWHLGYSGNASRYNEYAPLRIDKEVDGINIRQHDIDQAMKQVMDLAIEHEVDAVLNAGDSWDFWKANPYVYNQHAKEVTRLTSHGIDYVEVVGNHDLPKQIGKGCHLESLGLHPRVYTSYRGSYEVIRLEEHNVSIHCAPSTFYQEHLDEMLQQIRKEDGKINIGMGHFGVTSISHYAENAINSLVVDLDSVIRCDMNYFALGDYHVPTDFGHNICYSGPIERLGFGDVSMNPQVWLVEINKDTHEVQKKALPLRVRPMFDLPVLNAEHKSIEDINQEIETILTSRDLTDAIVRFRISKLPTHLKHLIDADKIARQTENALHFKLELKDKVNRTKDSYTAEDVQFEGVVVGFKTFMKTVEDDGSFDKEDVYKEGIEGLEEALDALN
ncbi:metallophosphoesterase (plasmid) [Pontibacillus sp. ALD_SL1]|uniref:metallophosphoesterase family protein n=1 Tax=Pontibacillus sp. ALD_SL1 TaxID=2777185 RepID=UPI001A9693B1|nr:metallophosphoesterase [Pontibacillus sp. ALD_SL1]QST02909.1 metallophosphoesterase [Pontibacillus sp. ALD_SL1]